MAGPRGPIWPRLLHKGCSNINISLIQSRKASNNCSHRELHIQYLNQGMIIWMGNARLRMDLLFQSLDARYPTNLCRSKLSNPKLNNYISRRSLCGTPKSRHGSHVYLRMFTMWTWRPPNNFGCQHNFHFKLLYLFQYWGGGIGNCNTSSFIFSIFGNTNFWFIWLPHVCQIP